jgi:hypothetical protein
MNARSILAVSSLLVFGACGGLRPRVQPGEGKHLTVPYVSDRREEWGPAALADVLGFWGRDAELNKLRREIRFTGRAEDVALDLKNAALARGLKAEMVTGDLTMVKQELDAGRPVLALVNIGFDWLPVRAYMVVVGYSDFRRCVYAHWGPNKDFFVSYRQFESDWEKAGGWLVRLSGTRPAAVPPESPTPAPAPRAAPVNPQSPVAASARPPADVSPPKPPTDGPRPPNMLWLTQ